MCLDSNSYRAGRVRVRWQKPASSTAHPSMMTPPPPGSLVDTRSVFGESSKDATSLHHRAGSLRGVPAPGDRACAGWKAGRQGPAAQSQARTEELHREGRRLQDGRQFEHEGEDEDRAEGSVRDGLHSGRRGHGRQPRDGRGPAVERGPAVQGEGRQLLDAEVRGHVERLGRVLVRRELPQGRPQGRRQVRPRRHHPPDQHLPRRDLRPRPRRPPRALA